MASLIPGYEYDIFISYRQKDNKHDGWVAEFVDNLKGELESMFKDEVSVYFDINPSDYLLESYDIGSSLKDKLKCLIFIPIISRTYCDPKSFAWDNELLAFVNQASADKFGFKIKLPNGNFANRVLPIRIHDLDVADVKLFESVVGGFLRSIDFVYKETGVNRQLRVKDDDIIKSPGQILYRDQINKVALTIKDIIESMKGSAASDHSKEEKIQVKTKVENKESMPGDHVLINGSEKKEEPLSNKAITRQEEKFKPSPVKLKILIPGVLCFLVVLALVIFLLNHRAKVEQAKEVVLPEIERLINERNYAAAFNQVENSKKYLSNNLKYKELASQVTTNFTILSDPPGADVYIKEYSNPEEKWKNLGKTPINNLQMPNFFYSMMRLEAYTIRFEKEGYEDVLAVTLTKPDTLFRKLFKIGTIPKGMAYVEGYGNEISSNFLNEKNGFFIDRYEVTNGEFKEFVDRGCYNDPKYWKNEFIKDGKVLSWKEAMALFKDKTGRPGPSTWEAGNYLEGESDYPVSGISWYEAAAYAEFVGKNLPTLYHWGTGAGLNFRNILFYFSSKIIPLSNFNGKGPEQVGKYNGINCFGAYDMAGNVREWCWNKTKVGRIIRGGAWNDATYMFSEWSQLPPFDRSPKNGFRCVKYIDKTKFPAQDFDSLVFSSRDFSKENPVTDDIFKVYKNQFLYDKTDLNAKIEKQDTTRDYCIVEKITFNHVYGKERMIAYLFIPKNTNPPYQTIVFFPGSAVKREASVLTSEYTKWYVDFLVKNKLAVIFPVYKGTFERIDNPPINPPEQSHQYTEELISWTKDLSRSIDYLETRKEFDLGKLCYYGVSWGGWTGGIIPAVEERLKLSILVKGGFSGKPFPEADEINYLPRIKIPVLMLNGKYDLAFPFETAVKPFFNLLGTPEKDKSLRVYDTDHYIPRDDLIRETLNWLEKYFGPVDYQLNNK